MREPDAEGPTRAWQPDDGCAPTSLDLQTRDVFDAALFYGEVLGRVAEKDIDVVYRRDHVLLDPGKRTVLSLRGDGRAVAAHAHLRPRWLVSFGVDDVERAVAAAVEAGGSRPGPADIHWRPERFSRTLRDPDGGMFSLTHRKPRSG